MLHNREDVQTTRETLPGGGYAYVFRHRELGLLGRLVLRDVGPNQMEVRSEVVGDPADPKTKERQSILEPLVAMVVDALQQRHPNTTAQPSACPPPPPGYNDGEHVVASKLLQCEVCDSTFAMLIFAEEQNGNLEDHARLMYAHIQQMKLPTYVLGPQMSDGRADVLPVYPTRQPVQQLTEAEFQALLEPLQRARCGHSTP